MSIQTKSEKLANKNGKPQSKCHKRRRPCKLLSYLRNPLFECLTTRTNERGIAPHSHYRANQRNAAPATRAWLKPKDNLLVVFEESGGDPNKIEIMTVNRDTICSVITEYSPLSTKAWERKNNQFQAIVDPINAAHLSCPEHKIIEKVEFVVFGDPEGACGAFKPGKCDSKKAHKIVEQLCLGKAMCTIKFDRENLQDDGKDACSNIMKTLAAQVKCSFPKKINA